MCILESVGRQGKNAPDDIKTVQILFILNLEVLPEANQLTVDGLIGAQTMGLIELFQRNVLGLSQPDGRIDVDGRTLRALQLGMATAFSAAKLHGIMINAAIQNVEKFSPLLIPSMRKYTIDTPLRQAHFLAQVAHESGSLRYTQEIASGEAYEGRVDLGNTEPGDGVKFKGRGLIQLTGRANYTQYGDDIAQDLITNENYKRVATEPGLAVDVSCWFWQKRNLNRYADHDDVRAVTKRINGGYNGLAERMKFLRCAKFFLIPLPS